MEQEINPNEIKVMKEVAVSIIAKSNTEKSFNKNKLSKDSPYWSKVYQDVEDVITREIALIKKCNKLKRLMLLIDESVSNEEMNKLSAKQWSEFVKCFPEEA